MTDIASTGNAARSASQRQAAARIFLAGTGAGGNVWAGTAVAFDVCGGAAVEPWAEAVMVPSLGNNLPPSGNGGGQPGDSRLEHGYDPAITGELPEERTDRQASGGQCQ